jgi:hypothetical protein
MPKATKKKAMSKSVASALKADLLAATLQAPARYRSTSVRVDMARFGRNGPTALPKVHCTSIRRLSFCSMINRLAATCCKCSA